MVELKTLSRYPFLDVSRDYVSENDITVKELFDDPLYERARVIGIERIDNAFENGDVGERSLATKNDCIMELLSYPIARMITVCVGNTYFKRRYALGEAVHAYKNLIKENISFLLDVAEEFDLKVKQDENDKLSVYFTDYLHSAPTRYKSWKMINRDMKNGYVYLSKRNLARLIQEKLRDRINYELDQKDCNQLIYKTFEEDIERFRNKLKLRKKKISAKPIGEFKTEMLPPCMKNILSSIQNGENVPHMGRFAFVSFLNSLSLNVNEILKLFSSAPDYEEEKTRYQVEHITGRGSSTSYKPPSCEKMNTYGLCPTEEKDRLCKKVPHPMSYYRAKWRRSKKDKKKSTKKKRENKK
ncbi:MAG: DNA primase large subunit PriL [Candidatus Thermoplasmatota archaeon]